MTDPADRALARSLAETHWHDMIDAAFRGDMDRALSIRQRLDERIQEIANELPSERQEPFLIAADEERNRLADEYEKGPQALKRRIGAATAQPETLISPRVQNVSNAQSFADTAVRTAVRATVWETVRAIFRSFGR